MDIDLWFWRLDPPAPRVAELAAHLAPDEAARAARFVRPEGRAAYRTGRGRLREILASYTGDAPAALRFAQNAWGRPELPAGPAFNLSHAAGWAALAVSPTPVALGIDIEGQRNIEPAVAERFFSTAERQELDRLRGPEWAAGFFRCWTRKEALIKGSGEGLSLPLHGFDVTLTPGAPARIVASRIPQLVPRNWSLLHLDLHPTFVGALAVEARGTPINMHVREGRIPLADA